MAAAPLTGAGQRAIRLVLEYDGTDFAGWQIQARDRTVQGELALALQTLLQEPICPIGAGRTDAGTHALGQVAHFHTHSTLPLLRLQRGLNSLLPPDIAVLRAEEAPADFHVRYSALSKRYRYRIRAAKSAIARRQVWTLYYPLDLEAMQAATRALPGAHSFAAFCNQDPVPENFTCCVLECGWARQEGEMVFEIEADRFLRHMVRILVGTMVEIGRGRRAPEEMAALLDSADRRRAGATAPAHGLCLVRVSYGE